MPVDLLHRLASSTHETNKQSTGPLLQQLSVESEDPIEPPAGLNFIHLVQGKINFYY